MGVAALVFIVAMTAWGYHAWWPVLAAVFLVVGPAILGRAMVTTEGGGR